MIALRLLLTILLPACAASAYAQAPTSGRVFHDRNHNAAADADEKGIANVAVSNGRDVVRTDSQGRYSLVLQPGQTLFVIKPEGWLVPKGAAGLPAFWRHHKPSPGPALRHGGIAPTGILPPSIDFPLTRPAGHRNKRELNVLVFGDPQPKSLADVDYYERDIIESVLSAGAIDKSRGEGPADLGLSLGDIVHDDLSLYPAMNAATARLGVPWLHVAGNHDLDFDAKRDEESLLTFRNMFGPDTFAWEEASAVFIVLDDVIYQPGQRPAYVGGLREDQFDFLDSYLPTLPKDRLLVVAAHIPFFDASSVPGQPSFRAADRTRLFALLKDFPHVLLLSAHNHTQQHVMHDAASGWHGAVPLHEYNVGAACGAYWSGVKDSAGIPDTTMADGTPNGYARLKIATDGTYTLAWHAARDAGDRQIALHAPRVLRQGAYPAFAVFANVFMGGGDTKVEYRIDGGQWKTMSRTLQADPWLLAENMRDDLAPQLRGYDRAPPAEISTHLWRGTLPTDLGIGEHVIEVRAQDALGVDATANTVYRLDKAAR